MCSGKIYYDLIEAREKIKNEEVVFVRIQQLYPFPAKTLANVLKRYRNSDFIWCQEEPMNQGAWYSMQHRLREPLISLGDKIELFYAGRDAFAAPAVGYPSIHNEQQKQLVDDALLKIFK